MRYSIEVASAEHAEQIASRLSDVSREDIDVVGQEPLPVLLKSMATALVAHVGCIDDEPVCMWGLEIISLATGKAYLWMLTTPEVANHRFRFIRISQELIKKLLCECGFTEIRAVVLNRHESSMRWLRLLRFEAVGAEMVNGEVLTCMVVRREAWHSYQN